MTSRFRSIVAFCIACLLCVPTVSAQTGTWVAHEEEWEDYLIISEHRLLVLRIDDRGKCLGAPLPITIEDSTLKRDGGSNWPFRVHERDDRPDRLRVQLPDTIRTFERTLFEPVRYCSKPKEQV